ncbi:head-tail connector protein [Aquibium microcysteis]|uniref:head-tail connector protein n=1 Tax=Aquibium microcysteis TaxID=675281 RepID=UPI00165D116E|nr:head-tail connector protein [Aquibium microcysteis]
MSDATIEDELAQQADWEAQEAIRVATADLRAHLNVNDCAGENAQLHRMQRAAESWIGAYLGTPLADLDPVPDAVRMAVLMLAGHFYENREASLVGVTAAELPFGVVDLIRPFRVWSM